MGAGGVEWSLFVCRIPSWQCYKLSTFDRGECNTDGTKTNAARSTEHRLRQSIFTCETCCLVEVVLRQTCASSLARKDLSLHLFWKFSREGPSARRGTPLGDSRNHSPIRLKSI